MYYVHKNGKCATNETIGGIRFNKNGYASNLTQARCKLAARNFIDAIVMPMQATMKSSVHASITLWLIRIL